MRSAVRRFLLNTMSFVRRLASPAPTSQSSILVLAGTLPRNGRASFIRVLTLKSELFLPIARVETHLFLRNGAASTHWPFFVAFDSPRSTTETPCPRP